MLKWLTNNFSLMPLAAIFAILIFALSAPAPAVDKKRINDAVAAVDANLKTPEGKRYDEQLGKEFTAKYLSSLRQCKQNSPNHDPFDMFLRLDSKGKVQEGLVYPETQFAACLRSALSSAEFSAPSRSSYWINIHIQLAQ